MQNGHFAHLCKTGVQRRGDGGCRMGGLSSDIWAFGKYDFHDDIRALRCCRLCCADSFIEGNYAGGDTNAA